MIDEPSDLNVEIVTDEESTTDLTLDEADLEKEAKEESERSQALADAEAD